MALNVDRGDTVAIEVEFKKLAPHASLSFFAPNNPTYSITDVASTVVASTVALSLTNANSTGLYHAIVQTSTEWVKGLYEVKVRASDGTFNSVEIEPREFELV